MIPCLFAVLAAATTPPEAVPPITRRFPADSGWKYQWVLGSDPETELFIEPRQLVVVDGMVVVFDAGTRDVHLIEAATGRPTRRLPARGTGPGEFKRPTLLLGTPDGFAILDQATARLTAFSLGGRVRWDALIPDAARLAGACIPVGGRLLLSYRRAAPSLVILDTAGRTVATSGTAGAIPWHIRRPTAPDFVHEHHLSTAGQDGQCALVPIFGGEWALTGPTAGRTTVHPLIEPGELPRIRQSRRILERTATHVIVEGAEIASTRPVASGAMRRGDTVIVLATSERAPNRRLLDYYDASTGRYLHSRWLPALFAAVTTGPDGTFYATHIGERTQVVVALRPTRRISPATRRAGRRAPPPPPPPGRAPTTR